MKKQPTKLAGSKVLVLIILSQLLSGCFFTKLASVPLRIGGAIISVAPVVGNSAHDAIDKVADTIDEAPI